MRFLTWFFLFFWFVSAVISALYIPLCLLDSQWLRATADAVFAVFAGSMVSLQMARVEQLAREAQEKDHA